MLSSKQNATTLRKKLHEDEKLSKKKTTTTKEEENKNKTLLKKPTKPIKSTEIKTKTSTTKTQIKRPPLTPPSSRVTKTQFFSSKPTTQKILPAANTSTASSSSSSKTTIKNSPRTENKKKSTNSKNERTSVKEFIKKVREDNKKKSEEIKRPGTATLKNPVVLKNVEEQKTTNDEVDYEDDFDSYESDFESESSSSVEMAEGIANLSSSSSESAIVEKRINSADEEKKLDSGTFDLTEQKHKQVLHNIRESVEKENLNPASLPDEGFEDVKSLQHVDNGCFINFASAQKQLKRNKIRANQRKRGEEILNMIKLDSYNFTLFDLAPMTYERYIKLYGQQNCLQASSQTGDDNVDDECQTDDVIKINKWTQAPVTFSRVNISQIDYLNIYKQEFMGVGDENANEIINKPNTMQYNKNILSAGRLLLGLLQENSNHSLNELQNSDLLEFSSGYIECNTETVALLKNTFVTYIALNSNDSSVFLTVHKQKSKNDKTILCIWYLSDLNQPENILVSYSEITCCCFGCADVKLIFSGSNDGTISVWKCKENFFTQNNQPQVPQCISEVGFGHISNVISIQSMFNHLNDNTNQLSTLDCDGNIIFWSVINKTKNNHTGDIILTKNTTISLNTNNIQTTNMLINHLDPNHLFVATSMGYIIHTLISNTATHPKKYCAPIASEVTCMAACPFSELYFLVGYKNGCVALYSRIAEKPLILMISKNSENTVQQIEWSCSKPCVFYVKHQGDLLDIWDLTVSDMVPVYSLLFKKQLGYIKLMPTKENHGNFNKACMVVGYDSGELQLHILNKEHGQNSIEGYKQDIKRFLNYVNRL